MIQSETSIFAAEFARVSKIEENASGEFQSQSLANCFDTEGTVHHEYFPEGGTVNQHYSVEFLKRLRLAINSKRPNIQESLACGLHHLNVPL
jgi:hypothetical protein